MKKNSSLTVLFLVGLIVACSKFPSNSCDVNKPCYTQAPDSLFVELQLTPQSEQDTIFVSFYEGNVDDGELLTTFTTSFDREYFYVPVRKRFSASARYKRGDNFYTAVDGQYISVKSSTNCEQTCYNWDERVLDLKLKVDEEE
jgi:hypothetical protein